MKIKIKKTLTLITSILLIVILLNLTQNVVKANPEVLDIDVSTDKQAYNVGDPVNISVNVTLDQTPITTIAAIEIYSPYENPYIIRTVATGDISGAQWRVQIINFYTCDSQGVPKTTFNPGTFAYANLTIKNTDNYNTYHIKAGIYLQSSNNTPILAFYPLGTDIREGEQMSILFSMPIPSDAPIGEAKAFASLFTDAPKNMGYPHCPEKTATFYIKTTTPPMPPQPQYSNITFTFPQGNVTSGNYTIYATAHYGLQTKIEIKQLTLRGPVAIVTYYPSTALVSQTITFNASASYSPYGNILRYYWNFGDEITRTGSVVSHAYETAGRYTVKLILTDTLGVESTLTVCVITISEAWPMFRHDSKHSGSSTSLSPVINTTKWLKVIGPIDNDVWMYPSPIVIPSTSEITIFAASKNGTLYALNSNGNVIWSTTISSNAIYSSPAFAEGLIIIGSADNKVYAINASDGQIMYTITTLGSIYASPVVLEKKVYVGSQDAKVYAFHINGTILWTSGALDAPLYCSPIIANGKIYIGTANGTIYALNETTGTIVWSKTLSPTKPIYASPTFANGIIFIASTDNNVYALDSETGNTIWNVTTAGEIYSSPAVDSNIVFVGCTTGDLYAINAGTGAFVWTKSIGSIKWSSPLVAEGKVFVGTEEGKLCALKENNGYILWSYQTSGAIASSPAILNETLYAMSKDGKLYAFYGETHDIALTEITPYQILVKYTETATINISLWNKGSFNEVTTIVGYCNNTLFYNSSIILNRGAEINVSLSLDTTPFPVGNYIILVNATLNPPTLDSNMSDNSKTCQIRIEYGDIQLLQIIPSTPEVNTTQPIPVKDVIGRGYSATVYVTVKNKGNFTEHNIQVAVFWSNNTYADQLIDSTLIPELPINASITVNITWYTNNLSYGNYTLSAYAYPVQGENYTVDNACVDGAVKIGVPGDVTSDKPGVPDGITNARDTTYCLLLFNSEPNDPNWKPNADINNDGIINARDVTITIIYFNKEE